MSTLDNLLDSTLDDLADLPEFVTAPSGAYRVTIELKGKDIAKNPAVELAMKVVETVELTNPEEDKPLIPGTEFSTAFMLNNEYGQGALKEVLKTLQAVAGGNSSREVMENAKGLECLVVMHQKLDKNGTMRSNLKNLQVV